LPKVYKIYGAPGTGKTTWMLNKLENELEFVPLERIAFVTHTVAAKREAKERSKRKFSYEEERFKYFKTIHGICYSEVGFSPDNIMQPSDYLRFGDNVGIPFSTRFTDECDIDGLPIGYNFSAGNEILAVRQLAAAKDRMVSEIPGDWPLNISPLLMKSIMTEYSRFKEKHAKFDFIDMLQMYQKLGQPLDIEVMFIDEAQDLSELQWKIVEKMWQKAKRVYIAGDDDQSIYGFLGAAPNRFLKMHCDDELILPTSYRLKKNVWDYAQNIIKQVHDRKDKKITVRGIGGEINYWNIDPTYLDLDHEEHTMIIARHHKQLQKIRKDLTARGVPYIHNNKAVNYSNHAMAIKAFLKQGEATPRQSAHLLRLSGKEAAARNVLRIGADRHDARFEVRLLDLPGISLKNWVTKLSKNNADIRKNEMLYSIIQNKGLDALGVKPKIHLTTYHGSKGREADHVVLFTDCYDKAWAHAEKYPDDERRLSYVGVTRAREKITIMLPQTDQYMRSLK